MPLSLCAAALGLTLLVLGSPALAETATKEKVMAAIPELEHMPYSVTFGIGPDQKASQVTIEDLNDDGQGVLGRVQ